MIDPVDNRNEALSDAAGLSQGVHLADEMSGAPENMQVTREVLSAPAGLLVLASARRWHGGSIQKRPRSSSSMP